MLSGVGTIRIREAPDEEGAATEGVATEGTSAPVLGASDDGDGTGEGSDGDGSDGDGSDGDGSDGEGSVGVMGTIGAADSDSGDDEPARFMPRYARATATSVRATMASAATATRATPKKVRMRRNGGSVVPATVPCDAFTIPGRATMELCATLPAGASPEGGWLGAVWGG